MKKVLIMLLLISFSKASMTKEEWTKEGLYQALVYADYRQTKAMLEQNPYWEANPLITKDNVEQYFVIGGLVHGLISYVLPTKYKAWFQNITLVIGSANVYYNYKMGITF